MEQLKPLSNREWQVVKLLLQGKSNKLIAASLGISNRTVEFHLKNIYAKQQVSSRVELILKLGNTTGKGETAKLGSSTVVLRRQRVENGETLPPRTDRGASFKDTVSFVGMELQMKNLLNNKHVYVGVLTALFTGFVWVALLRRFGHASMELILPWIPPLTLILVMIGTSIGIVAKRNGNSLLKAAFSAWVGTGMGSVLMIPLTVLIVLPLGKLVEWLGLVDRAAMPENVITTLVYGAMIGIWLIVGIVIGIALLFVAIKKPARTKIQMQTEHGS